MSEASFVRNCRVIPRPGEGVMFRSTMVGVFASLDGYVILPKEQYARMEELAGIGAAKIAADALVVAALPPAPQGVE